MLPAIFKRGIGCLTLFVTFFLGTVTGYLVFWFDDAKTPFIDRQTATRYAIYYAQDLCSRTNHPNPVACTHYRATIFSENAHGWRVDLVSGDGRRSLSVLVDRKGNVEAEDLVDLDDPRTWPTSTRSPLPRLPLQAAPQTGASRAGQPLIKTPATP